MPESWTVTRTYLREVPVAPAQDGAPFRLRNLTPQGTIVEVESSSSPGSHRCCVGWHRPWRFLSCLLYVPNTSSATTRSSATHGS